MSTTNSLLDKMKARSSSPPGDQRPEAVATLNDSKSQANHRITLADDMLCLLGPSDPIP